MIRQAARKIRNKLRQHFATSITYQVWKMRLQKATPIVVYQMGKVGSKSIHASLREHGFDFVYHAHFLTPASWKTLPDKHQQYASYLHKLHRDVIMELPRVRVISPVREPVGYNVSVFFSDWKKRPDSWGHRSDWTTDELIELLTRRFHSAGGMNWFNPEMTDWFDYEMKQALNVDAYAYPFDKERGCTVIKQGRFEILLLQVELSDEDKAKAIQSFLGLSEFQIVRSNESINREYGEIYRKFLREAQLPTCYIDNMYNSRYARHFYTEAALARFRQKWDRHEQVKYV